MKKSKYIKLLINYLLYHKYYRKTRRLLSKKNFVSIEDIIKYQFDRLKQIIEYSYRNVPYYRELFTNVNFHPDDFKSIEDIKRIPYLTKNMVRENQDKLLSQVFPKKYLKVTETGGTTGLPMAFLMDDRTTSIIEMAYLTDMWKKVGYRRYDKCIILKEDTVEKIVVGKKYWKMNYITNWLTMSSFHLNSDTFQLFYNKIVSFKPKFIMAFPSNAYLIARYIKEKNLPNIPSLKAILCGSENIYDWQRKYMEEVFKARVFSHYGHSEKCVLAAECSDPRLYEFYPQYGYAELINEKDEWCSEEDEKGEIVATGFNNYVSPFIRYKTDDIGIFTKKHSHENPNWFTIKSIEGRKQDYIIDKDNTPKTSIHIDRPFWKIRDKIYAYQYIQNIPGKVEVNVHSKDKLNDDQIAEIKKIFLETYFKFDIEVNQVDDIPRTKGGKFRYLVQNIKDF